MQIIILSLGLLVDDEHKNPFNFVTINCGIIAVGLFDKFNFVLN